MILRNLLFLRQLRKLAPIKTSSVLRSFISAPVQLSPAINFKHFSSSQTNTKQDNLREDDFAAESQEISVDELNVYKSTLPQSEIAVIEKILFPSKSTKMTGRDFTSLLSDLKTLNLANLQTRHLYFILKFLGGTIYRRAYLERTCAVAEGYVDELKSRPEIKELLEDPVGVYSKSLSSPISPELAFQKDFLINKMPNVIVSCSNLNLFDHEIYKSYQSFLQYHNGKFLRDALEIKTILALYWSYKKLNKGDHPFYSLLVDSLKGKEQAFSDINCLRLLWIMSIDFMNYPPQELNSLIKEFVSKKTKKPWYSYNQKNASQVLQICYSLYPALLKSIKYDPETGKSSALSESYETIVEKLHKEGNLFMENFREMYDLYLQCKLLVYQNNSEPKVYEKPVQMTYVEYRNVNQSNFYVIKNKIITSVSLFEKNVAKTLESMNDLKFFTKVKLGLYDVDLVVYPDIILEVNGGSHYVVSEGDKKELIANFKLKRRHLKNMGFTKLAYIPFKDWEKTDDNVEKRQELLRKYIDIAKENGARIEEAIKSKAVK